MARWDNGPLGNDEAADVLLKVRQMVATGRSPTEAVRDAQHLDVVTHPTRLPQAILALAAYLAQSGLLRPKVAETVRETQPPTDDPAVLWWLVTVLASADCLVSSTATRVLEYTS